MRQRKAWRSREWVVIMALAVVVIGWVTIHEWRREEIVRAQQRKAAEQYNGEAAKRDAEERNARREADAKKPVNTLRKAIADHGEAKLATLGSSVTAGSGADEFGDTWIWKLYNYLRKLPGLEELEYSNNGFGGHTTSHLLKEGKVDVVIQQKPTIVLFEVCLLNNHSQSIPLATTLNDIDEIVERLQAGIPGARIILQSPNQKARTGSNSIGLKYEEYLRVVKEHVAANGWEYVDIYSDFERQRIGAGLKLEDVLKDDGVHPNSLGYGYWAETLKNYFEGKVSN